MTSYGYDSQDRQTVVTDAMGKSVTTVYDAEGEPTQVTDRLGRVATTDLQLAGLGCQRDGSAQQDDDFLVHRDRRRSRARRTPAAGAGRPVQHRLRFAGPASHDHRRAWGTRSTTVYDAVGNTIASVDANGNR